MMRNWNLLSLASKIILFHMRTQPKSAINNIEVSTFADEVNKTTAAKNELENDQNIVLPELKEAADRAKQAYEQALAANASSHQDLNSISNNELANNAEQNLSNDSKNKSISNADQNLNNE